MLRAWPLVFAISCVGCAKATANAPPTTPPPTAPAHAIPPPTIDERVPTWVQRELDATALPSAANTSELRADAENVVVTKTQVVMDGERLASVQDIVAGDRLQRIDELFARLKAKREAWKAAHPGEAFPGVVQLWIDRATPALVVKSVFQTAAFAGYPNGAFVVRDQKDTTRFALLRADALVPRPPGTDADGSTTSVSGRLPPEVIQRIIRGNYAALRACYVRRLAAEPGLAGKITVRFVIGTNGDVTEASADTAFPNAKVTACVVDAFRQLKFPAPEGGIVTVTYPILFEAD
jgi:TonB family protein